MKADSGRHSAGVLPNNCASRYALLQVPKHVAGMTPPSRSRDRRT